MEKKAPGRVPVTKDMTFGGVEQIPLIAEAGPYLIAGPGQYHDQGKDLPLEPGTVLGWNHERLVEGIEDLMDRAGPGTSLSRVHPEAEWGKDAG